MTDIRIEPLDGGRVRFHFGGSRGYKEFETIDAMRADVLPWIGKRMKEISTTLNELSNLQQMLLPTNAKPR